MANIFKNPTHVAKMGYNGFDMSQNLKFSSTVGELLPVYYDLLQPGDKVSCNSEIKTRTQPLASAAYAQITEHVDWFFVPMEQIYTPFGNFFFNLDKWSNSILQDQDHNIVANSLPYFSASDLNTYMSVDYTAADTYFPSLKATSMRLMDALGIPASQLWLAANDAGVPMSICPIFACAYQKIYFDYYRLEDRELNNAKAYNLDLWSYQAMPASAATEMFTLRYRAWRKDFFTSLYPSPLMGSSSVGGLSQGNLANSFHQWLLNMPNYFTTSPDTNVVDTNLPTAVAPSYGGFTSTTSESFRYTRNLSSPTYIRTSFAVQKLLEITRRAGKSYDAQQLAHFGVKLPRGINGNVFFLGSQDSDLNIGDVISTAQTNPSSDSQGNNVDGLPLGYVGGKGYNFSGPGEAITFEAPCHGILMAIYSAEPKIDYTQYGLDKLHTLIDRADWYLPEFDNLGMQPLFNYQAFLEYNPSSDNYYILGWQYRYSEIKTKYDRVIGALYDGRSLAYWTPQQYMTTISASSIDYKDLLINPSYLDDIMLVNYDFDGAPDVVNDADSIFNLYQFDPFTHQMHFNVKKSSKMSTYGLESL